VGGTCLKRYNILNLCSLIYNHYNNQNLKINILEVGVARGDTSKILVEEFKNATFYLFDTFEGLPSPTIEDCKNQNIIGNYKFSLEDVKIFVGVKDNVHYIKGRIEDTLLKSLPNEKIHFIHLDVDLYQPTYYLLDNIIPKMAKPSIIIIDDYGIGIHKIYDWQGIKKACDEIEQKYKVKFNLLNNKSLLTQAILFIF